MKKLILGLLLINLSFTQLRIAYDVAGEYAEKANGIIYYYDVQAALSLGYDHIIKTLTFERYENDSQLSFGWGIDYKFKREVDERNMVMSFISPYLVLKFDIIDNLFVCNRIGRGYNYNISFDHEELEDLNLSAKPRGFYSTSVGYRIPNYQNRDNFEIEIGFVRNYFRLEIDMGDSPPYNAETYATYNDIEYSAFTVQIGIPIPSF